MSTALMLGSFACVSDSGQSETPTPHHDLPIVALTRDLSVTMIEAQLLEGDLTLTFRIADLMFGRGRLGYELPDDDEVILDGLKWAHGNASGSLGLDAVYFRRSSLAQIGAWDLTMAVSITDTSARDVSVSITRLRPVELARTEVGAPDVFEGPWVFTFDPVAVVATPVAQR